MATTHKLATDWDPEFKVWHGTCSCKKWFQISSSEGKVKEEFKKHLEGK